MTDRIATLQGWLADDPDDAFSRYALAMELKKAERHDEAAEAFGELVRRSPDYHATYYHYAALLVQLGRRAEARTVLRSGIEVATRLKEEHALEELKGALTELN